MRVAGEARAVLPEVIVVLHRSVYYVLDKGYRVNDHFVNRSVYLGGAHDFLLRPARNAAAPRPERRDHLYLHGAAPEPGYLHAAHDRRTRHLGRDLRLRDRIAEHRLG